eukprot:2871055-Prymnesium_polylepis.1
MQAFASAVAREWVAGEIESRLASGCCRAYRLTLRPVTVGRRLLQASWVTDSCNFDAAVPASSLALEVRAAIPVAFDLRCDNTYR